MSVTKKPEGYPSVSVYMVVNGALSVIEFLQKTFDATELRRYTRDDGSLMHAEVRIDDSVVMIADATASWPATPSFVHVFVNDVDATYRRALDAGGVSIQEPRSKGGDDPDRRGGVKDPGGNTWWISTQVG